MVKLASGDMVRFEIDANAAVIQVIGRDDVPRIEKEGRGWRDGDIAVLTGSEVALLLYRLTTANADGCVTTGATGSGSSKLLVNTLHDELGRVTVVLETDDNVIHMKAYERDMLVDAINSQVWRMFR